MKGNALLLALTLWSAMALAQITTSTPGQLWGTTAQGGKTDTGVLFRTNADGSGYELVKEWVVQSDGWSIGENTQLTMASNGKFYGVTLKGGLNNDGVIFEYDPASGVYTKKFDFKASVSGSAPGGITAASNGKLYGLTSSYLFEYDIAAGAYTIKYTFSTATASSGVGKLVINSAGNFYGIVNTSNVYSLFEYNPATNTYTGKAVISSDGHATVPPAAGPGGKYYGMVQDGGANGSGIIYSYDPASNSTTKLFDFTTATSGYQPRGSLIMASNNKFYGIACGGGSDSGGVLFEYDPAGAGFTKKFDFQLLTSGSYPRPSITEANGKIYGFINTTYPDPSHSAIFEYDLLSGNTTRKKDIQLADGHEASSTMTLLNGKLYGMTNLGALNNVGALYEYDPAANSFTNKYNFSYAPGGAKPTGALVESAAGGKFYGMTTEGGAHNVGTIYSYEPLTETFTKVADFDFANTGGNPVGSLTYFAPTGKYYGIGTPSQTGVGGGPSIFEFDPSNNTITGKVALGPSTGTTLSGSMVQGTSAKLYGMVTTYNSGTNLNNCTIFSYNPTANTYLKEYTMPDSYGSQTRGDVTLFNGKLYGMTTNLGANGYGVIVEYNPSNGDFAKKFDFTSATGGSPFGSLTAANGKLYAMTRGGGVGAIGTLIEFDVTNSTVTSKFDFTGSSGGMPTGSLLLSTNGNLYGLTKYYGSGGSGPGFGTYGTIIEYNPSTGVLTNKLDFSGDNGKGADMNSFMQSQSAYRRSQTLTFPTITDKTLGAPAFSLAATATSNMAVKYSTTSDKVTIAGSQVTIVKAGSVTIKADQPGSAGYSAAPQLSQTFCINPVKPVITLGTSGNTAVLTSNTAAGNQWYFNGTAIPGSVAATFQPASPGIYTLKVIVDNCTSEVSAAQALIVTGDLTPLVNDETKIYPNPVKDKLTIQLNQFAPSQPVQVTIHDITGKVVERISGEGKSNVEIDVSRFSSGIHIITAAQSGKIVYKKFIKE